MFARAKYESQGRALQSHLLEAEAAFFSDCRESQRLLFICQVRCEDGRIATVEFGGTLTGRNAFVTRFCKDAGVNPTFRR